MVELVQLYRGPADGLRVSVRAGAEYVVVADMWSPKHSVQTSTSLSSAQFTRELRYVATSRRSQSGERIFTFAS